MGPIFFLVALAFGILLLGGAALLWPGEAKAKDVARVQENAPVAAGSATVTQLTHPQENT